MARNFYEEASELASAIRADADAQAAVADRIEYAIASGFTATEVLMGLRFQIREALDDQSVCIADHVRRSAAELADAIDEALGT